MKSIKKILTAVLFVVLIISSVLTISAEKNEFSGIVSKEVSVSGSGDVEISIDLAGNPGITALILDVSYDSEVLTLEEDGFTDTELLVGKVDTTITRNPFRLSWQHSDATAVNNYKNGTIAKLRFKMKEGFYGTTDVSVKVYSAQSFVDDVFVRAPAMENGVISLTREKFAIKDGVVIANNLSGETLIVASYDENSMIDCRIYPYSTGDFQVSISDELNITDATKVKAFLWESLETLVPVCDFLEEEL